MQKKTIEEQLKLTLEQYKALREQENTWLYKNFTELVNKISGMSGNLKECASRLSPDYLEHQGMWEITYSLVNECHHKLEGVLKEILEYQAFVKEMNEVENRRWNADEMAKENAEIEEAIKMAETLTESGFDLGNKFQYKNRTVEVVNCKWAYKRDRDDGIPF